MKSTLVGGMMMKLSKVSGAVALGLGVAWAVPSVAAESAPTEQTLEKIEVTGSSIKRTDSETASPIQVITADQIKKSGLTSIADVLQRISANGAGTLSNANSEAFAGGASGIALRGLSVGATLVLIDGHRMAGYPLSDDGERAFTDISNIPFDAVERIDILKDGASAIYGSDAIAGVVNIILKRNFLGTNALAEMGRSQHGGGANTHFSVTHGVGDLATDGYNAYVNVEVKKSSGITYSQRSFQAWDQTNWTSQGGNNLTPGVPNIFNNGLPATRSPYLWNGGSTSNPANFQFFPGCSFVALNASQCGYAPPGNVIPPTENVNVLASLTKHLGDSWDLRAKASFFDSKGQQQGAALFGLAGFPTGSYAGLQSNLPGIPSMLNIGSISNFSLPATYPGNTLGAGALIVGTIPGLPINSIDIESKAIRAAVDVDGTFKGWDLGLSVGYTNIITDRNFLNFVNNDALYAALQSTTNPFLITGGNSAAMIGQIAPAFGSASSSQLDYIDAKASRDLFDLPGGALSVATGIDLVHRALNNPNPGPVGQGTVGGTFSTYASGNQNLTAVYAELNAPVIKALELTAAARLDHYDTYGNSFTPKFGFKYKPIEQFALRGTFSQGFRAPSAAENGSSGTLFGLGITYPDPILCGNDAGKAAGQIPSSCTEQPGFLQTTTKSIKPERSDSYTLGIILEPIKGWGTTFDYYNIKIKDQIITAAEGSTYSFAANCIRGAALPTQVSDGNGNLVQGTPLAGPIGYCLSGYVNANTTKTNGFDIDTQYNFKFAEFGNLQANLSYTHLDSYTLELNGLNYQLAGTHGPSGVSGDTGNPKNHAQLTLDYSKDAWIVTTTINYVGPYDVTDPSSGHGSCSSSLSTSDYQFIGAGPAPAHYCTVSSFTDTDLTVTYLWNKHLKVHATVDNLFDREPPVDLQTYGGSFFAVNPSLHTAGIIGRFFNIGASYSF